MNLRFVWAAQRCDGKPFAIVMTTPATVRGPLTRRIFEALLLRRELYEAVANDPAAGRLAAAVVCLCAVAQPTVLTQIIGAWGLVVAMLLGVLRWWIFTTLVWPAARLLAWKPVDYRRLLRCLGFAEAPSILNLGAFVIGEAYASWLGALVAVWLLASAVVAVRAACNVTIGRAVVIGTVSFAIYLGLGVLSSVIIEMAPA